MTLVRNRPTEDGKMFGTELARLTQTAIENAAAAGVTFTPCKSCAFRAGTVPNGCPPTVMDALKCVMEREPFFCHEKEDALCQGYAASVWELRETAALELPWDYSTEPEDERLEEANRQRKERGEIQG